MDKLDWYSLEELDTLEPMTLVKCFGIVKFIQSNTNYFSFTISNGNSEAQATIYDDEKSYSVLDLPMKNDIVIVIGNTFKRELSNKNAIVKIKIRQFNFIRPQKVQSYQAKVIQAQKKRQNAQQCTNALTKTKRSLLKQMKLIIQPIQIRSLILGCVYVTLDNNPDLQSYTFSIHTIKMHRLTKGFVESKKLKEESIEYMDEFIDPQLKYLLENRIIEEKKEDIAINQNQPQQKIYKISTDFFNQIKSKILGIIYEKKKTGTVLSEIVNILNRDLLRFAVQKNFVLNDNFVQLILRKFIEESQIYKTSQKVLYPNS